MHNAFFGIICPLFTTNIRYEGHASKREKDNLLNCSFIWSKKFDRKNSSKFFFRVLKIFIPVKTLLEDHFHKGPWASWSWRQTRLCSVANLHPCIFFLSTFCKPEWTTKGQIKRMSEMARQKRVSLLEKRFFKVSGINILTAPLIDWLITVWQIVLKNLSGKSVSHEEKDFSSRWFTQSFVN